MSATGPAKPSGIKPPTSRLVPPSVGRPSFSNGSSGESGARRPSEDLTKKKVSVDRMSFDDDRDEVRDLPSLPGSRKSSEQMRKLSEGSGSALDAAYELARRLSEAGVRRMSDANIVLTTDTDSFIIGQRVFVNGVKPGVIQFIGETKFAPGEWAGIVLDDLSGKNDGSVGGVRYFQCQPKKGVFSRLTRLTRQPLDASQLAALQIQQAAAASSAENGDAESSGSASRQTSPPPTAVPVEGSPSPATNSVVSVQSIGDLRLGDRVIVTSTQGSKAGTLRFLGNTEFAAGQWAGVELDDPLGKNDGAVAGTRYFDCPPHYGLFAPIHKVSRSPANHMRRSSSSAMNSSMSSSQRGGVGLSRQSTRDSMGDRASLAGSVASSRASTAVSRVSISRRSTVGNSRPGVTSLTSNSTTSPTYQPLSSRLQKGSRPSIGGSTHGTMQDLLREKEQQIEQLMKEREMERSEVTRAAAQADEAEHQLALLQNKFKEEQEASKCRMAELEKLVAAADSLRSSQAAQIEDLQFRLEEQTILRSDLETQAKNWEEKEKELARQVEQLESEAQRCFEAEELAARCKDELDALVAKQSSATNAEPSNDHDDQIAKLQASLQEVTKSLEEEKEKSRAREAELAAARESLVQLKELEETRKVDQGRRETENEEQLGKLDQEKTRLESELEERKKQLDERDRQIADVQEQLAKLSEEKDRLESDLFEARELGGELDEWKSKCQQLESLVANDKEKLGKLANELAETKAGSAQTAESDKQLRQEWETKYEEMAKREADARQLLTQLEGELATAKAALAQSEDTEKKLSVEWKTKYEDLEFRAQEDQVRFEQTEADLKQAKEELDLSEQARKKLSEEWESKYQESQSRLEENRALLANVEAELKEEKALIAKQAEDAREAVALRQELENRCGASKQKLKESQEREAKMESELAEIGVEKDQVKGRMEELERQMASVEQKSSQLAEEKARLESEVLRLSSSSNDASQDLTRLHGELMVARQSLADAQSQLGKVQQDNTGLEQLNASLRSELLDKEQKWVQRVAELEAKIQEVQQKVVEASAQQAEQERQLIASKEENNRLVEKVGTLESNLADAAQTLSQLNDTLAAFEIEKTTWIEDKARLEELTKAIGSQLALLKSSREESLASVAELEKSLAVLESEKSEWMEEKERLELSLHEMGDQLAAMSRNQESSVDHLTELNATVAALEEEKSSWLQERARLTETIECLETQLLAMANDKEQSVQAAQEREGKLALLTEEVERLRTGFAAHKAELEVKLSEHKEAAELEEELRRALAEAREKADHFESALLESRATHQETLDARQQVEVTLRGDLSRMKESLEALAAEKDVVEQREAKLEAELKEVKNQIAEQTARLQNQLQETKQEAESVHQLLRELDETKVRIKELESALEAAETRNQSANEESQQSASQIALLEQQVDQLKSSLLLKETELKEEMEDRDRAEDRVLKLTENLIVKDKELEALRHELCDTKKSTDEVSRLLSAFSNVDREKKQLEAKVVELQVAAARSAAQDHHTDLSADARVRKLQEELENSRREVDFLNSVIVDMQRKLDELKMKLEISQATLLGQSIANEHSQNGTKLTTAAPRLFCDICDMFDLHDTEDCPTQASSETDSPPALLNRDSLAYSQHSHHGGARGSTRPYCENCEMFGHLTSECEEEATY